MKRELMYKVVDATIKALKTIQDVYLNQETPEQLQAQLDEHYAFT
jgi:hypothetical protein